MLHAFFVALPIVSVSTHKTFEIIMHRTSPKAVKVPPASVFFHEHRDPMFARLSVGMRICNETPRRFHDANVSDIRRQSVSSKYTQKMRRHSRIVLENAFNFVCVHVVTSRSESFSSCPLRSMIRIPLDTPHSPSRAGLA